MNSTELRDLAPEQITAKIGEWREELFKLRFQHATSQLEKTHQLANVKKNIARALTVLGEKKA